LTDDELDQITGKRDNLVGKVQEKYGIAKEEAEKQVKDWKKTHSLSLVSFYDSDLMLLSRAPAVGLYQ